MNIGKFRSRQLSAPLQSLEGDISTLSFSGRLIIKEEFTSDHPNAPSHKVLFHRPDASNIEIGAAWTQQIKSGERSGKKFLSVQIDDPSMPHPLSFGLFEEDENGNWVATWRRRQSN